ncbi:MAG TPA: hypothetical protein VLJ76_09220, partial [Gaiellaceae bacterium]|nr:hypothetical protein [Gaiellaceae bacterium]
VKNYRHLDQSRNSIARQCGEDVLGLTQPNSILLVSGDGFAFPLIYLRRDDLRRLLQRRGGHA